MLCGPCARLRRVRPCWPCLGYSPSACLKGTSAVPICQRTLLSGTDGNHPAAWRVSERRATARRSCFECILVEDAAFHAAGDRHDLAGDVARELVRGEDDHLARDVVGLGDLAQSHRPRDSRRASPASSEPARHRRLGPARRDRVHARARRDPHDLVLQAQQQAVRDRRLGRRVVRVPGLADEPRGRADEHEAAVAASLDLRAGSRARSGRTRSGSRRSVASQRSSGSSQTGTSSRRPDAGDGGADVDAVPALRRRAGRPRASSVRSAPSTGAPPSSAASASRPLLPRW